VILKEKKKIYASWLGRHTDYKLPSYTVYCTEVLEHVNAKEHKLAEID